jgi:hypothetical protein
MACAAQWSFRYRRQRQAHPGESRNIRNIRNIGPFITAVGHPL